MSGDDKAPKKLTDQQRIDVQVGQVNALAQMSDVMHDVFGFKHVRILGSGKVTDFEDHDLNHMIDLVHHAKPADLEHVGEAFGKASKAISDAAAELRRHLKYAGEDWKGEAGSAFQAWGEKLAKHADDLATFADNAKVQITAAATGLASVRSSMPPRDTRAAEKQKRPGQLPAAKQVESNAEYAEAVRVEKDRQEAINQMNRLASFYAVSGEELAKLDQTPPVFEAMPDVGVPGRIEAPGPGATSSHPGGLHSGSGHRSVVSTNEARHVDVSRGDSGNSVLPTGHSTGDANVQLHLPTVGTEINSVGTLPPETAKPAPVIPPSASTGPSGPSGEMFPPMGTGAVPPVFGGPVGRTGGFGGTTGGKAPVSAQGRVTTAEGTTAGGRGPVGPVGRPSTVGQPGARGPVSATGRSPMGRGVTGGMPRTAGTVGPRNGGVPGGRVSGMPGQPVARTGPGATGAARTGGVVGGKPAAEAGASTSGGRVPRGTVIGGEGAPGARTTGERPGQRGVIGANNSAPGTGQGQSPRRSPGNPDGVVGAPAGRVGARGPGAASGGTGLVRGSAGDHSPERAADGGTRRQDHSAEDKKRTRGDARRGDAPSATD
ncbi:WXG100 family type VII secretion target [Streptomyces sp. NPDC005202]|uniref:WXG100 family type VII secretion target n=1 Tax=Streptomyces sp. NPDC005202 TaxID=3157021 RepID=UPI0033A051F7